MNNKFEDIYKILKKDNRLVSEDGSLLKNKLHNLAMNMDEALLELLLSNETTKDLFFKNINNILIFDKVKFSWLIDSKDFLPDSYTAFKNKIMLTDDKGNSIKNSSDVVLSFPFKDCVLEADSTKDKEEREEIFLNEVLMKREIDTLLEPKVFTNAKKYSLNGEEYIHKLNDDDNLIIKGNNLLALHSLVPRYKGKIKCMYWDILYNTKSDSVPYNDSFKHSSWLTMMKNRLEIAKKLLSKDGVMLIQCDKNEDSYLRVLCDEVFGRDNFVNSIAIQSSTPSGNKTAHKDKTVIKIKDTILIYKMSDVLKINPQYIEKTKWDTHYDSFFEILNEEKNEFSIKPLREVLIKKEIINKNEKITPDIINNPIFYNFCIENRKNIIRKSPSMPKDIKNISKQNPGKVISYEDANGNKQYALNGNRICFLDSGIKNIDGNLKMATLLCDIWTDIDFNNTQNEGGNSLPSGKKPEILIKRILEMFTKEGDIVLDAYLGSGTTSAVAHKLNRKYICIEQLDSHIEKTLVRMNNVIKGDATGISKTVGWKNGGSFVSCELKTLSYDFIKKINTSNNDELNKLYEELKNSEFVTYRVNINKLKENQEEFNSLTEDEKRKFLIEVIDKNLLYLNYSEIDDENYNISEEDKLFNHSFYRKETQI